MLDLGRQRSKGYELVGAISVTRPETAVAAMSAYPAQEAVRFARAHAQAFLDKPCSLAELVDVVDQRASQEGALSAAAGVCRWSLEIA